MVSAEEVLERKVNGANHTERSKGENGAKADAENELLAFLVHASDYTKERGEMQAHYSSFLEST